MARVTIVGPAHPFRGGLAAFNHRLYQALEALGHQVDIITFTVQYPRLLFPGVTQYADQPAPAGITIVRRLHSLWPLSWWQVGNYLRRQAPDVIVFKFWMPFMAPAFGTVARIAKRNRHSRVVAILDNVLPHERHVGDAWLARYFLSSCDRFIAMSDSVKAAAQQLCRHKPIVKQQHPLYDHYGPPVDRLMARQYLGLDPKNRYVLFFGFVRKYKGLDILMEAMSDARFQGTNIQLLVAGEFYEPRSAYDPWFQREAVRQRVVLHDRYIDDHMVPYYFSACDVVVLPYRSATQSGIIQLAYYYGLPVVATRTGGLSEMIEDGTSGLLTEPDPQALASTLLLVFEQDLVKSLSEGVCLVRQRYDWEAFARCVVANY